MTIKLATVNLNVSDPVRSKGFYEEALGMVEDARRSHPPDFYYLKSDGCDLTLAGRRTAGVPEPSRSIELGFEVDDIAAARARLASCGVLDYRDKSMGWGSALELQDADGYRIVVYAMNPR
jgi:catechol 2,3-dioxygenase-like lactoylglutathione lyase family enzyme